MSKANGFDGEAFGKELTPIIRAAIDERVASIEARLIELGERVARLEGKKSARPPQQTQRAKPQPKRLR